jgi:hypothetical protein
MPPRYILAFVIYSSVELTRSLPAAIDAGCIIANNTYNEYTEKLIVEMPSRI